jgi:hypothetical protein
MSLIVRIAVGAAAVVFVALAYLFFGAVALIGGVE